MDTENNVNQPQQSTDVSKLARWTLRKIIRFIIPIIIVAVAIFFFKHQMDTRPKAKWSQPPKQAKLVKVEPVQRINATITIYAMGTVVPAKEIELNPEITGVINAIDPVVVPGGIIQKGQTLFKIDSRDYETVVKQCQGDVAQAMLNLKLESGNQTVAQKEYKMLEEVIDEQDKELILRRPHLKQAQVNLEGSQALLKQAKLNVARCTVKAPFNAIIKEKYHDIGARVSPSNSLISMVGMDEYWVEVMVPEVQLQWIKIPTENGQTGSTVKILNPSSWEKHEFRTGEVIRLLGQLEERGRMAQLLVSAKDPLCLQGDSSGPKLLIGSYVRVEIEGTQLSDVFRIRRGYLRDGNSVWIMNADNKLEIRQVEIIFRGKDEIYTSKGLQESEGLITTDISAPVEGMDLRVEEMDLRVEEMDLRVEEMTNPLQEPSKDEMGDGNG